MHNHYRTLHDTPLLEHHQDLEDGAQAWARTIAAKGHLEYCEKLKSEYSTLQLRSYLKWEGGFFIVI